MAKKSKFLMVSLQDDQAKALANVLSNKTSRRILEYLADKEDTESGIAKALGLAISTVHYNLQQLQKGGLIDIEEFHYSKKGKIVNHYKLANQYILIAPKSTFGLKEKLKNLLPVLPLVGGISLAISYFYKGASYVTAPVATMAQQAAPQAAPLAKAAVEPVAQMAVEEAGNTAVQTFATTAADSATRELSTQAVSAGAPATSELARSAALAPPAPSPVAVHSGLSGLDIGLIFFVGAIAAIVLYLLVDYLIWKYKNRS